MTTATDATTPSPGQSPDSFNPLAKRQLALKVEALRDLDMEGLANLYSALRTIDDVMTGLLCQPRFLGEKGDRSPAGNLLDEVSEFIVGYGDTIAKIAQAATPMDPAEIEYRGWIVIDHAMITKDSAADVAIVACEVAASSAKAEFKRAYQ